MGCREYSKQLNEHRIGVLRTREEAIQSIVQEAKSKLAQITQDKGKYKKLLTDLIVQVRCLAHAQVHAAAGSNSSRVRDTCASSLR